MCLRAPWHFCSAEGVSILDGDGELFCDREADAAFFHALKAHLRSDIPVYEAELNINDPAFLRVQWNCCWA